MEDKDYDEILFFIRTKNYPKRIASIKCPKTKKDEKKKLRSKAKHLHIRDGFLVKDKRRVLRNNEVAAVMENMHAGKYSGGHLGRDKTYQKISSHYFWKGMKEDIKKFISDCDKCSRVNIAPPKSAPPLNSIPVPNKVWSLIGIDIIGPLETTNSGNKYIVAATDHFSKFSIAEAIPQKSAENVAKFLISAICTYGPMDSIITDQGKEFTNKVVDEITTELNIDHRISSSYHPQTYGQRERDNRTLKEMLQKVTDSSGKDWDTKIESCLFAYRTSVHSSTKVTPFEVMFGRQARLVEIPDRSGIQHNLTREMFDTIQESRDTVNEKVSDNIKKAQKKQKTDYDKRNSSHKSIPTGTYVLIKNASKIRRFGSKLAPRWLGPYLVVDALTKGRLRLQNVASGKVLANVYHSSNVKVYTAQSHVNSKQKKTSEHPMKVSHPKKIQDKPCC